MFQDELQKRIYWLLKAFCNVYISVDRPGQDIVFFNIPVIIAKKELN